MRPTTAFSRSNAHAEVPASSVNRASVVEAFRGAPHDFIDVGHSRLAHWRFGSGPDLVFIHGWPLNSSTFRGIVPLLADRFTCHLLDLPGAGKTQVDDLRHVSVVEHVTSLRRAIDILQLPRFGLLAQDSGGFIARGVAANDPRTMALVMGNTEVPGHTPWLITFYTLLSRLSWADAIMRSALRSRLYRRSTLGFGGCFSNADHLDGEFDELLVRPLLASAPAFAAQVALLRNLEASMLASMPRLHAQIRARVRLIWGTADRFFPIAYARRMLPQFAAGADLCEIKGGRLFVHEEYPDDFAAHAKAFLLDCFQA